MRKGMTKQDSCYTPKYIVDYFGKFEYDPATTIEQSKYLNINNFDTIDSDGLKTNWSKYKKIWINPPFTLKFEFLEKAVETYKQTNNDIYILFPIESLTTKRCYDILKDVKFKIYIPNYRIGFIVDNKQYRAGAFGICILHLQDENDIKLITREEIIKGSEEQWN